MKALIAGTIANEVLDRVFENAANDLVVPELGVYGQNGCAGFPIPDTHLLKVSPNEGIMHTTMFGYAPAVSKLMEWLA